jgi:two-component sensor histidine kinase
LAARIAGFVTWEIDAETLAIVYDTGLAPMFGLSPGDTADCVADFAAHIHPDDRETVLTAMEDAKAPGGRYFAEFRVGSEEAGWRWLRGSGEGVATSDGVRIIGFNVDITELCQAEEARQLLVQELDHRLKNLFTVAAGMVNMTARTARSPAEMAAALSGRLMAMSRAHDLIRSAVTARMNGGESASVHDLVRVILEPHLPSDRNGIRLEGPPLRAGPRATTSLALVLHELATNAAKYGALSVAEGVLEVNWTAEEDHLTLRWQENGGPVVEAPPQRKGFGTQLARLGVTSQLGGSIAYDWPSSGVVILLTVPLEQLLR